MIRLCGRMRTFEMASKRAQDEQYRQRKRKGKWAEAPYCRNNRQQHIFGANDEYGIQEGIKNIHFRPMVYAPIPKFMRRTFSLVLSVARPLSRAYSTVVSAIVTILAGQFCRHFAAAMCKARKVHAKILFSSVQHVRLSLNNALGEKSVTNAEKSFR